MKKGVIPSCLGLALVAAPLMAWADANPDFDDDAKPILRAQPGLVSYVRSHFEVKDTGKARYPGDDDHRPAPPYIFRARALGSHGPFNIRLLIEPGPPGHILCVVPPAGPAPGPSQQAPEPGYNQEPPPSYAQQPPGQEAPPAGDQQPPSPYQPQEAQQPYQSPSLSQGDVKPLPPENTSTPEQNPAPAQQPAPPPSQPAPSPSEPTADTPSGPIMPSSSSSGTANPQQTLAPPPDPAPSGQ